MKIQSITVAILCCFIILSSTHCNDTDQVNSTSSPEKKTLLSSIPKSSIGAGSIGNTNTGDSSNSITSGWVDSGIDAHELKNFFFLDSYHAWAVGNNGKLLFISNITSYKQSIKQLNTPDDLLKKWVPFENPPKISSYGKIFSVAASVYSLWIIGENEKETNSIWRSDNNGDSWSSEKISLDANPKSMAINLSTAPINSPTAQGVALTTGAPFILYRKADNSWNGATPPASLNAALNYVTYTENDTYRWIGVGTKGTILASNDADGHSWFAVNQTLTSASLNQIKCSEKNCIIVGNPAVILLSNDGGKNWVQSSIDGIPEDANLYAATGTAKGLWVGGTNYLNTVASIYFSADQGKKWTQQKMPSINGNIYDLAAINDQIGWAACSRNQEWINNPGLLYTNSGGQ